MTAESSPTPEPMTPVKAGRIDDACDRFEARWRSGDRPRIEEFLDEPGAAARRPSLLRELLALELELRARAGEHPSRDEYAARFPDDGPDVAAAFQSARPEGAGGSPPAAGSAETIEGAAEHQAHDRSAEGGSRALREGPGAVIGRYRIIKEIGQGGMGTVFMAEQTEPVRRRVALKIIKPGMDSEQVIARFEAERQALALMDHPNIAKVLDAGATENGRPYFVMELVDGSPLTQYCDANRLGVRARLELFAVVCRAVQHAHQKGIIHRDIKPSNVLVALQDARPAPKVIDFGIAKAIDQRLTERTVFTHLGQLVGTPEYMSPEQAELGALDVDTRSDVYSLGVLLYELLTGTTPLRRERLKRASYDEILRRIREEEPPRPSSRLSELTDTIASVSAVHDTEPSRLRRAVKGELDWIVMKSLEKERSRRYETCSAMARDIERYLADEPVEAGPPSALYRLRKLARKHRVLLSMSATMGACLILATAISTWAAFRATRAESKARQSETEAKNGLSRALAAERASDTERKRAESEAAIARAISEFLQNDLLSEAAPEKNSREKKVSVEELLDRASKTIEGRFNTQPLVEAAIRQTVGDTYQSLGNYKAARPHLERALNLRTQALGPEHLDSLTSLHNLGVIYELAGEMDLAESIYRKELDLERRVRGEEHPDTLLAMDRLATVYQVRARYSDAEPLFARCLEVSRRVLGPEHKQTLASMNNLGMLYRLDGQYARAEPLLLGAMEGWRRMLGKEHPLTLQAMNNLTVLYMVQGKRDQAEALATEVLATRRRVLGPEHPQTLMSIHNLARLYHQQGKLAEAETLARESLDRHRRTLGKQHPGTLFSLYTLATVLRARHKPADAEALFDELVTLRRHALGDQHLDVARVLIDLGVTQTELGKFVEAEKPLREGVAILEKVRADSWEHYDALALLGDALAGQKKYAEAEPLMLRGYEGLKAHQANIPAPNRGVVGGTSRRIARLYTAWGKPEKAAEWQAKEPLPADKPSPPSKP